MRENNVDRVKEWFPLKNGILFGKLEDDEGVDDFDKAKSINRKPFHFGSYNLSHGKRLLNDVIKQIDGLYNNSIYYIDTDSLYIHKKTGLTWLIMDSLVNLLVWVKMITEIRVNFMLGFWVQR